MLGPITSITPAQDVFLPVAQAEKVKPSEDPFEGVPPFWRQLNQNLAAAGSDQSKFAMLARLAQEPRQLPPMGEYFPPEVDFKLHQDEIKEWARDQRPGVRGRLYRLMRGANLLTNWPYYVLQNEGRFDPLWQKKMSEAAERYIKALKADRQAVALLRQDLEQMPGPTRRSLAQRMVEHASSALEIPAPKTRVVDKALNAKEDGKDADTVYGTPIRINFYPKAFARGSVNLIVTVFHEAIHAQQMNLISAARSLESGKPAAPLDADESGRAAILELSMMHLHAIDSQRQGSYQYYLYRYATEAEREAHLAELAVAILAADCAEFNPIQSGTLRKIKSAMASEGSDAAHDPNMLVTNYVKKETGFDPALVGESAGRALHGDRHLGPTLYALAALRERQRPTAMVCGRVIESSGFEATIYKLATRHHAHMPVANLQSQFYQEDRPEVDAMNFLPAGPVGPASSAPTLAGHARTTPANWVAGLWTSMLKLEQLRDPLDTSDMLSHALLSAAPALFYGQTDEAEFLRSVVISALDASSPPMFHVVSKHLARRFGCVLIKPLSAKQFRATVSGLQRAWFSYRSALSRKIIFEVACHEMGFSASTGGTVSATQKARRDELRRAISGAGLHLTN